MSVASCATPVSVSVPSYCQRRRMAPKPETLIRVLQVGSQVLPVAVADQNLRISPHEVLSATGGPAGIEPRRRLGCLARRDYGAATTTRAPNCQESKPFQIAVD